MSKTEIKTFRIDDENGARLDVYLAEQIPEFSRATIQKLIKDSSVLVNGVKQKTRYSLHFNDEIKVDLAAVLDKEVPDIDIPILYEDEDCLVISKPVGLLSHSKGVFNPEPTVATFVQQHSSHVAGDRGGIVHRLDRATSGVMICAKTPEASSWLQKQFSIRKVKKTYVAKIMGQLDPKEAVIDMPIERNPKKPQTFRVGSNGKDAMTHYLVLSSDGVRSLVELKPETGRTHQLRVHLAEIGHPIIGDVLYGGAVAERLYLHAASLEITLPNRERKTFTVELPESFKL